MNKQSLRKDYSYNGSYVQLCLPFEIESAIPVDESVRLLDWFLEDLDYTKLYQSYSSQGRNPAVDPKVLFKILVYAYSQNIFSSREIERACRLNLAFQWLLRGNKKPDHNTISRFRSERLLCCAQDLLAQIVEKLHEYGEVSFQNLFIDGTKIEANAGLFTFKWKKSIEKNEKKLQISASKFLQDALPEEEIPQPLTAAFMQEILERWKQEVVRKRIVFVHGSGHRKTPLQRNVEKLSGFLERKQSYDESMALFEGRNSYSKTDTDATFMRMKEDHMKNGQLKAAYNLQIAVESEYIVAIDISAERSDCNTLKPFLQQIESNHSQRFQNIVADAGYESEENYEYLEEQQYNSYIKPSNYERSKTRAYRKQMEFRNAMVYFEDEDVFQCAEGRTLFFKGWKKQRTASGYQRRTKIYECENCEGCPHLGVCYRGKYTKRIEVNERFGKYREQSLANITSEMGILLRMNRSIQAEGAFAELKWNMGFRRYLTRGKKNVRVESLLLAMGFNINKLHQRIQNDRIGVSLFPICQ